MSSDLIIAYFSSSGRNRTSHLVRQRPKAQGTTYTRTSSSSSCV